MKKLFYSLLSASILILPACNSQNENGDEDYKDTAIMSGYDDPNYNEQGGGVPVSPDTAQGMDQSDNMPGNETGKSSMNYNKGSDSRTAENNMDEGSDKEGTGKEVAANRKKGFKTSGQYDSRKMDGRPRPVNTDDIYYKENPPAHSYGDTAPRHDGVNSVR